MPGKMGLIVLAALTLFVGCPVFGYDPEDPVTIHVDAPPSLNTYGGTPHALDLYVFKIADPLAFQSTELEKLKVENQAVPGGQGTNRHTLTPGTGVKLSIGPMVYDMYIHVGVVAAYREPMGNQVVTAEIPGSGELKLVLGPNGIITLTEAD